jgi:hypothetical protein
MSEAKSSDHKHYLVRASEGYAVDESKVDVHQEDKNHKDLIEHQAGSDSSGAVEWTGYSQPPALGLRQLFSNGKL